MKGLWIVGVLGVLLVCLLAGHDGLAELAGGAGLGLVMNWLGKGDES